MMSSTMAGCSHLDTILKRGRRAGDLLNTSIFNTKGLEGFLDKFLGIVSLNDLWGGGMLDNDF